MEILTARQEDSPGGPVAISVADVENGEQSDNT